MRNIIVVIISFSLILSACHSSRKTTSSSNGTAEGAGKKEKNLSRKEREKQIEAAIRAAYGFKGTPYKPGGMDEKGIDCSGLIKVCYQNAGLDVPRTTGEQAQIGNNIRLSDVHEGDLLFFATNKKKSSSINHVGLVTKVEGDEQVTFIHASLKKGVMENSLTEKYYKEAFVKAIRPF